MKPMTWEVVAVQRRAAHSARHPNRLEHPMPWLKPVLWLVAREFSAFSLWVLLQIG